MRSEILFVLVTLLMSVTLPLGAAPQPGSAQGGAPSAAEEARVRAGVNTTLVAFHDLSAAGKWDQVLALYANDSRFRWWTNGAVVAKSVADIEKGFRDLPAGTHVENTFSDPEITSISPGVALVATHFETRVADAQGRGYGFGGLMTMMLIEQDGAWRILNGHASSPMKHAP